MIRIFEGFPRSRQVALAVGASHYFTGQPCANGHVDKRRATDRKCAACNRMRAANLRKAAPTLVAERNRTAYLAKQAERQARQREWNAANAERAAGYAANYRARKPDVARAWRQKNKQRVVLYTTRRRAAKLQRTPAWADTAAIDAFYLACPEGHHVDHIVPLRGRLVSGLHVLNNLQYLPNAENLSKGNKFDPDTFEALP